MLGHHHSPGCGCGPPEALIKAEKEIPGARVFYRDRPIRQLHEAVFRAYEHTYARMLEALRRYLEKKILGGSLLKADPPAGKPLSPEQINAIRELIVKYHDAFIAGVISSEAIPSEVLKQLISEGILPKDVSRSGKQSSPKATQAIKDAFVYGVDLGSTSHPKEKKATEKLSYAEWKKKKRSPLSSAEKQAISFAEHSAADRIKGLGNRIAQNFTSRAIEAEKELRRKFEQTIRSKTAENIERRDTWRELWSQLGHESGDWSRDLARIAATEKMDALLDGQAKEMAKRGGGPEEVRVAKQPNPGACPDCVRLYTKGGVPKVFLLSELQGNGTNIGKKKSEWLPTLGPVHPYCACELIEVPSGWGFDEDGNLSPLVLKRSDLEWNLYKSLLSRRKIMTYGDFVGDNGISIRVGDPRVREAVEEVVSRTPSQVFTRASGVTLITTDHGRAQTALNEGDLAYWVGNEIRLQQTISPSQVKRVLEHELGHALNSWLLTQLGNVDAVREWHDELWKLSQTEGFVTRYAKLEPIENAAEVTRLYLYYPDKLRHYPRQFSKCHRAYKDLFS